MQVDSDSGDYYSDTDSTPKNLNRHQSIKLGGKSFKRTIRSTNKVTKYVDDKGQKHINQYRVDKKIGEGSTSVVKLVIDTERKRKFAMKIFYKTILKKRTKIVKSPSGSVFKNALQDVYREISIMSNLNHRNVIRLHEVIDDDDHDKIYMIIDYASGGEVITWDEKKSRFYLDPSKHKKNSFLDEEFIRYIFRDCVKGLDYIHKHDIVHRDLKPQNILLDDQGMAKISDFGISHLFPAYSSDKLEGTEGTYHFMAPESLKLAPGETGFSGKLADIWSLGVTLYCFIFLKLPFYDDNLVVMLDAIQNKPLTFPGDRKISPELKDLLQKILEKNPKKRLDLLEISNHPWVNQKCTPLKNELQKLIKKDESQKLLIPLNTIVFMKNLARKLVDRIKKNKDLPALRLSVRKSLRHSFSEADFSNDIYENINKLKIGDLKEDKGEYELLINENPFLNSSPQYVKYVQRTDTHANSVKKE